jgi:putative MATE family efflux protein
VIRRSTVYDREIWRLTIPAFGALVAEPLYVLSDTAVVGHLGTDELGGLAIASAILLMLFSIFVFLAYGTTAAVARLLGAGREREAAHQAVQGMWLALGIGVVLTVVGEAAAAPLVRLFGAEGAIETNALVYLRISLLGVPAMLVMLAGTGYLRGRQDTRTPLLVSIGSASANLALELVLIFGLDFGIGASALSTVIAQVGAATIYVWWVGRAVRQHDVGIAPDRRTIGALAVVGRDLFIRTVALRGSFVLATAAAARLGSVDLAAHQIAFEVWAALALGLDAIAIAGQAMIGRFLGAGRAADARAAARRMIEWGVLAGVAFGAVVAALHGAIPHLFSSDEAVVTLAGFLLLWAAAMQPVCGVVFVLDGVLIGAGDMRFLAWSMAVAAVVFAPLALGVAWLDAGIGWLWAALYVLMLARAAALVGRFAGTRWMVLGAPA